MPICKTEAIILRSRRQGETSKLLSLVTPDFGRMSMMAKGARSIKSHYGGVLEPLNHIAIVFYHKQGREIQYLSQADLCQSFPQIHTQLGKLTLASVACELIERHEIPGSPNPTLFRLLLRFLTSLETATKGERNVLRSFQLHYLELSGFRPNFKTCQKCHQEKRDQQAYFDFDDGGYRCFNCSSEEGRTTNISGLALRHLDFLARAPIEKATLAVVSSTIGKEMDWLILNFFRYHIEHIQELHSIGYLQQLQDGLQKLKQGNGNE